MSGETREAVQFGDETLRVPKVAVPVRLVLDGGIEREGKIYLAGGAGTHSGRERALDLLNADAPFLPVAMDDGPRLLARHRIVYVAVTDRMDAGLDDEDLGFVMVPVEIHFASMSASSSIVRGIAPVAALPGHARLLDFLNYSGAYFPIIVEDGVLLVSRRYVTEIRQIQ